MEWQPIETAPKDGTAILTLVNGYQPIVAEWHTFDGYSRFCVEPETFMCDDHFKEYFHELFYEPTHWMPLPAPPNT